MPKQTKYKQYLRDQDNMSQREVSKKTGISPANVNLFANGYQNITIRVLKKYCVFHKCSPNDILDWEKWEEEAKKKKAKKQTNPES